MPSPDRLRNLDHFERHTHVRLNQSHDDEGNCHMGSMQSDSSIQALSILQSYESWQYEEKDRGFQINKSDSSVFQ